VQPALQTLSSRSSTATSRCWWSVPPCSSGKLRVTPPAARASTPGRSRRRGWAAPRPGTRLAAPAGVWPAQAQLGRTQHHPLVAIGPSRRPCQPAAADAGDANQPEGENEEAPPQAWWPTCRSGWRLEPQSRWPGPAGLRSSHPEGAIPVTLPTAH
jgi:hypothetical protein